MSAPLDYEMLCRQLSDMLSEVNDHRRELLKVLVDVEHDVKQGALPELTPITAVIAKITATLILLLALSGCAAQPRVQDQAFRDFLTFRDICQNERGLKPEACQELWNSYMDAKAKQPLPVKQEVNHYSSLTINRGGPNSDDPVDFAIDFYAKQRGDK